MPFASGGISSETAQSYAAQRKPVVMGKTQARRIEIPADIKALYPTDTREYKRRYALWRRSLPGVLAKISADQYIDRQKRTAEGLCNVCGKAPAATGHKRCDGCIEHYRKYSQGLIDAGLCVACRQPSQPGRRRCDTCVKKIKQHNHDRYAKRPKTPPKSPESRKVMRPCKHCNCLFGAIELKRHLAICDQNPLVAKRRLRAQADDPHSVDSR